MGPGTLERLRAAGLGLCHRNRSSLQTQLSVFIIIIIIFSLFHSLHLLSSSLLSPQSSAPSHTQRWGMQRWLAHSNWVSEQNLSAGG